MINCDDDNNNTMTYSILLIINNYVLNKKIDYKTSYLSQKYPSEYTFYRTFFLYFLYTMANIDDSPQHSDDEFVYDSDGFYETPEPEERHALDIAYTSYDDNDWTTPIEQHNDIDRVPAGFPIFDPEGDYFESLANDDMVTAHLAQAIDYEWR